MLARVLGVPANSLTDDSSPDTIASWDSLAHMMIVVELESEYSVSVAPEDAIEARTVAAIKAMLTGYGVRW